MPCRLNGASPTRFRFKLTLRDAIISGGGGGGGRSGNKWEAHSGSTRPGEFCDFDGAQGRAMRALFLDYCNELS